MLVSILYCCYFFSHTIFWFLFCVYLQFDNVNNCFNTLHRVAVGGLDRIATKDICAGELGAIYDLFYALSVYKQATKQKTGVSINNKQQPQAPQTASAQAASQSIHQPLAQQQQQLGSQPNIVNASNEMLNR